MSRGTLSVKVDLERAADSRVEKGDHEVERERRDQADFDK